jgi:NMD protein affecting ribosome stability and mRNA decay
MSQGGTRERRLKMPVNKVIGRLVYDCPYCPGTLKVREVNNLKDALFIYVCESCGATFRIRGQWTEVEELEKD